jgi:hypothetical protein
MEQSSGTNEVSCPYTSVNQELLFSLTVHIQLALASIGSEAFHLTIRSWPVARVPLFDNITV